VIAYQKVVDLQPDSGYALTNLGASLHAAGDVPRAIEYYKRSIDLAPTELAHSNLGTIYHSQRRSDEAIAAFEAAIRISPSTPVLYRNLGDAHKQKGDAAAAARAYEHAIQLATANLSVNPNDADMMSVIALCEAKLSRFGAARSGAERAVQLAPESGAVLFRAACVDALAGRAEPALALLERALAKGFSRSQARQSEDFARLREDPRFVRLTAEPARR
jgi:tetratricopeptide (TPR) repeat protein